LGAGVYPGIRESSRHLSSWGDALALTIGMGFLCVVAQPLGIHQLAQFRAGRIDAQVQSLIVQGEIIAGAIAASAGARAGIELTGRLPPPNLRRRKSGAVVVLAWVTK
jgi:Sensor N-terminal transmembrane domain